MLFGGDFKFGYLQHSTSLIKKHLTNKQQTIISTRNQKPKTMFKDILKDSQNHLSLILFYFIFPSFVFFIEIIKKNKTKNCIVVSFQFLSLEESTYSTF